MIISYKIIIKKSAKKFIDKNKKEGLKFYKAFVELAKNKHNFIRYDIKKLKGKENIFRIRIGKNRAIFLVSDEEIIIIVFDIGSRGDIYK